jgi:hypothetical protein
MEAPEADPSTLSGGAPTVRTITPSARISAAGNTIQTAFRFLMVAILLPALKSAPPVAPASLPKTVLLPDPFCRPT